MKKMKRKTLAYNISLVVIVIILATIFYFNNVYNGNFFWNQGIQDQQSVTGHSHPNYVPRPNPPSGANAGGGYVPPAQTTQPSSGGIQTASGADYSRFESFMPNTDLVKDIPSKGKIQLSFFNFNTGQRQWERSYILTTGSVVQGSASDADMKLILHSRNLPKLNENNVCEVFQNAKTQGDFGSELLISKAKFGWRYKSMFGYKSCLGF